MSTKKRRNDNAQMRREEYEQLESSSQADTGESQDRLTADQMQRMGRRTVRARRVVNKSGNSLPTAPTPAPAASNPFAKVNLAAPAAAPMFSFGAKPAAATSVSTPTPSFGFGSTGSTASATNSSKRSKSVPPTASGSLIAANRKELCEMLTAQDLEFKRAWEQSDPGMTDQTKTMWEYSYYRVSKQRSIENKVKDSVGDKTQSSTGTGKKPPAAATSTQSSGSTTAAAAPAPTPPFSFGSTTASAPAPAADTPVFSFKPAPVVAAPVPPTGGFSFTPAPAVKPAPVVATADKGTSKTTGFAFGGGSTSASPSASTETPITANTGQEAPRDDSDKVEKIKDPGFDDIEEYGKVVFYHLSDLAGASSWKAFATGFLRLQVDEKNPKRFRMVMKSDIGKVLINMLLDKNMTFLMRESKGRGFMVFLGNNGRQKEAETFQVKSELKVAEKLKAKLEELVEKMKD